MKRSIIYIVLDMISIMFLILGCTLFFGANNNPDNAIISKLYEHFHEYQILLVNKFPILHSDPLIFGMCFVSFGLMLMAGSIAYLRNSK